MAAYVGYRYYFRPGATVPLPTVIVCPTLTDAQELYTLLSSAMNLGVIETLDQADIETLPILNEPIPED